MFGSSRLDRTKSRAGARSTQEMTRGVDHDEAVPGARGCFSSNFVMSGSSSLNRTKSKKSHHDGTVPGARGCFSTNFVMSGYSSISRTKSRGSTCMLG